jgi:hypothetical protein
MHFGDHFLEVNSRLTHSKDSGPNIDHETACAATDQIEMTGHCLYGSAFEILASAGISELQWALALPSAKLSASV